MLYCSRLWTVLVLMALSMSSCQTEKPVRVLTPTSLAGCYDLTMSDWRPPLDLGEDKKYITPPTRIQLLLERGVQGFESRGYLLRTAPGEQSVMWATAGEQVRNRRSSYWTVDEGNVTLTYTNGFSGVMIKVRPDVMGTTLKGRASTFWDFNRTEQTAETTAHKTSCDKR